MSVLLSRPSMRTLATLFTVFSLSGLRKLKRKKEANRYVARAERIMSMPGNAAFANNNTIDVRSFRAGN
jgi:hypothetical protein